MEENITATPTPEAAPTPKKKKKGLLIGGILAAALVLAAGAIFALQSLQVSTPATTSEEDTLFHCGLVAVKSGDKWGYIDKTAKYVINPQFDDASVFSDNGLAKVKAGNKYGYIDKDGKYAINPQFDDAYSFADNGLALVQTGGASTDSSTKPAVML